MVGAGPGASAGRRLSRRQALHAAGAAGLAGAVLAGCGGGEDDEEGIATETGTESSSASAADVGLLNALLEVEHEMAASYEAVIARLDGAPRRAAAAFLEQERQHADALIAAVRQLGATPAPAREAYDLPRLRDPDAALRYAVGVERRAFARYTGLLPRLTSPDLRGIAASVATVEAEHLAVMREALGDDPIPLALVR